MQTWMVNLDRRASAGIDFTEFRTDTVSVPRPSIAKPSRRQHPYRSRFRATVRDRYFDEHVLNVSLGILDENIEIAVPVEYAGIEQLVFCLALAAATVFLHQVCVRKRGLGVLIEVFHVGMGRRVIEVEVVLFYVFAVVSLFAGQAKRSFFQDWIRAVP